MLLILGMEKDRTPQSGSPSNSYCDNPMRRRRALTRATYTPLRREADIFARAT